MKNLQYSRDDQLVNVARGGLREEAPICRSIPDTSAIVYGGFGYDDVAFELVGATYQEHSKTESMKDLVACWLDAQFLAPLLRFCLKLGFRRQGFGQESTVN